MSALFTPTALVVPFENLRMTDVESVGGKNASLGEMISNIPTGVKVPTGFATTAHAFRQFLAFEDLGGRINARLRALDIEDVRALAQVGASIRAWVEAQPFPADLEKAIRAAFITLTSGGQEVSFAVRSSATAEDLPDASFAGQQETFLNVIGIEEILQKVREVFASLYNDRAISYRVHKGFAHEHVALSAGIQRMVRSTLLANLFSVQSDCPHREKLAYGGDIAASSEMAMLNFDMSRFYAKAERDLADAARPYGALTETAPFVVISDQSLGEVTHPVNLG